MRDAESGRYLGQDAVARFEAKLDKTGECWLWTGGLFAGTGYGAFWIAPQNRLAHRIAYEMAHGPIPPGAHIDHLCRVRRCVNPAHLEAVSPRENLVRAPGTVIAINLRKTHCPQGHPYDEANTYRAPSSPGTRQCRTCLGLRPACA